MTFKWKCLICVASNLINMLSEETVESIKSNIQRCHNESSYDFSTDEEIKVDGSSFMVRVEGERLPTSRWGKDKYLIDIVVVIENNSEENWDSVSSDSIKQLETAVKEVLQTSLSYTGPLVVRSSDDITVKKWARRFLYNKD